MSTAGNHGHGRSSAGYSQDLALTAHSFNETFQICIESNLNAKTEGKTDDKIPKGKVIISESGISSKDYVKKIRVKVNAWLVAFALMNSGII